VLAGVRDAVYVYIYYKPYTANPMRTNIEIDDELIREALEVSGLKTKRAAVEAGLRALIRLNKRRKILDLAGKVQWEGNLDESREGRFPR
jgi:Arc/MetJ family transcription regulator